MDDQLRKGAIAGSERLGEGRAGVPSSASGKEANERRKLLFVCARNKIRSLTAEKLLAHSAVYSVRSRGVARDARIRLKKEDIGWADDIFVMEKNHKDRILADFREELGDKKIVCLFIEDVYEPMETALVDELRGKLMSHMVIVDQD